MKVHPLPSLDRKASGPVSDAQRSTDSTIFCQMACSTSRVGRQLHFWVGEKDYAFLRELAKQEEEPVARILRRMIRQLRAAAR